MPPYERDVNTVFQDYALFPHMTVGDNVAYGLMIRKVPADERRRRVADALRMVRLEGYEDRTPVAALGRAAPARGPGSGAREPAARPAPRRAPRALDLKLRQEMQIELKTIQQEVGITFIYVTHDQEEALAMSDRMAIFNQRPHRAGRHAGRCLRVARDAFVAGFVGASNILAGDTAEAIAGTGPAPSRSGPRRSTSRIATPRSRTASIQPPGRCTTSSTSVGHPLPRGARRWRRAHRHQAERRHVLHGARWRSRASRSG